MSGVPAEIWEKIMFWLDEDRDYQSFACVCSLFTGLKNNFWQNRIEAFEKRFWAIQNTFPTGVAPASVRITTLALSAKWVLSCPNKFLTATFFSGTDEELYALRELWYGQAKEILAVLTWAVYESRCKLLPLATTLQYLILSGQIPSDFQRANHQEEFVEMLTDLYLAKSGYTDEFDLRSSIILFAFWCLTCLRQPLFLVIDIFPKFSIIREHIYRMRRSCSICQTGEHVTVAQFQVRFKSGQ